MTAASILSLRGGEIEIVVGVTNNGFGTAPATTIEVTVPAGADLIGLSGPLSTCVPAAPQPGGTVLTCNVPSLGSTESQSLQMQLSTPSALVLVTEATIQDPTNVDGDPINDTLTETTTITNGADIELTIMAPASAPAGSEVSFTFTAENLGPNTADTFTFEFPVPAGLTDLDLPAGCTQGGGIVECVRGPLPLNGTIDFDFTATVAAASSSTVTLVGSVTDVGPGDAVLTNNTAQADLATTAGTDVAIEKTRSPGGDLVVGSTVTWDIDLSYDGDAPTGLTMTDSIPAEYTNVTITDDAGWTCNVAGNNITCTNPGGGAAGADVSLGVIEVTAEVAATGTNITNTATVTSSGPPEQDATNNSDSDGGITLINGEVDLSANKRIAGPPRAEDGDARNFFISATNNGNQPFVGTLVLADTIPAGAEIISLNLNGFTCSPALPVAGPATLTCERVYTAGAPLAVGARSPEVLTRVRFTGQGVSTNTLAVSSPDANWPDPDLGNNTVTEDITISDPADSVDLEPFKTAGSGTVASGDQQTFSITVANNGPQPATNVVLTDTFSNLINNGSGAGQGYEGVVFTANTASGIVCNDVASGSTGRRATCTIANLPVCDPGLNECPVFTFTVRPGGNAGSRTNFVLVQTQDQADGDDSNNSDSASYSVTAQTDVTVTKNASPDPVLAGADVTFVIAAQVVDDGASSAANVTITDTLPDDLVFVSATPSTGSCGTTPTAGSTTTTGNNQVICNLGTIGNGGQQTVTIVARPLFALNGTTVVNPVTVSTTTPESDGSNNSSSASVDVIDGDTDILINKDDSVDPVTTGDNTVYTITVTNAGPSADEDIVITDTLPTSIFRFVSATPMDGGVCTTVPAPNSLGGTLVCEWDYLESGDSVSVDVTMLADDRGSIPNTVSVDSASITEGWDRLALNNSTSETTTSRNRVDLGVTKVVSADPVPVEDDFTYTITVTADGAAEFRDALDTELTDSLPTGMTLTGAPTAMVTAGSTTMNSCTGVAGGTSLACDFGTMSPGTTVVVTVPVEVQSVSSDPQTFNNEAEISTTSSDTNPANNADDIDVDIVASEISGNVYFDYDDDAVIDGTDRGLGGITITLTGTTDDGQMITETTTTAADGSYSFDLLPAGEYTVTRGAVTEPFTENGTTTGGPVGTPVVGSDTEITSISLPDDTSAPENNFPIIPIPRVGISKELAGPLVTADDGSYRAVFDLVVENFAIEDFSDVDVTDPLAGTHPLFGSFVTLGDPVADPMTNGTYTIIASPSGSCGGLNGSFDGDGDPVLAANFTLGEGLTCTISFEVRVMPAAPLPAVDYENQATVEATGALTGDTSAQRPTMRDLSDDGANPDPNGDGEAGGAGEDDPTPLFPTVTPSIALIKIGDITDISDPPVEGDLMRYTFQVRNTGNVTLTDVTVTDDLDGIVLSGGPITLAPGETDTMTFTAEYRLTQDDVDNGFVENQATAVGTDPFGTTVDDLSATNFTDDEPLITPFTEEPAIALVKTADTSAFQDPPQVGDLITYSFAITNTGNVTLTDVEVTDTLPGIVIMGDPIASLSPGQLDDNTFTATYALTQDDIDNAEVINQALVTGTPPSLPDVTDDSGTTLGGDDPTVSPVLQSPSIMLEKSVDEATLLDGAEVGELLTYSFVVTNTGNVPLTDITIDDPLPGLTLDGGPIDLDPGEVDSATFTASYPVTADDIVSGEVLNVATVTGTNATPGGSGEMVTDDDDAMASVGTIEANPEPYPPFTGDGGTTTTVLGSDLLNGDPATLETVTITVLGGDPGPVLDPATGLITLPPGFPAGVYTVEYEIASRLIPTLTDSTVETIVQGALPGIETEKTQVFTDNGDGRDGVGDVITYTISVTNTGNVVLNDVALEDTLTDLNGGALSLDGPPVFQSASAGSPEGTLEIGEVATYTASFTVTLQAVNAGGVENVAIATGTPVYPDGVPPGPDSVQDISDDGIDDDGNTEDDPTVYEFAPAISDASELVLTKTTPRAIVQRGEVVPFTIRVENLGTFVAGPFDIVDELPAGMLYVPGSATIGGVSATVTINGSEVIWEDVTVPAEGVIEVSLSGRLLNGTRSGYYTNVVNLLDPMGQPVTPPAEAQVRILPDPVFDCAEVIGKVFNDLDGDGYQDPVGVEPNGPGGITDQTYTAEKFETDPPQDEIGIPGVRLSTVDGLVITTDQYGRFSVPCAALPANGGSNFILKLDDRSLPTGYRLTTENPRVMRLTPGVMSEINFGATLTRVVRVDLNGAAFYLDGSGNVALQPALVAGLDQVLAQVASDPATVALAFHLPPSAGSEMVGQARQLMDAVERHIQARWRQIGNRPLRVEQSILRAE